MMLRTRALVTGALIAAPVAALAVMTMDRSRARDLELALGRVVRSQVNAQVRERCESDPRWFLTGPLDGRPRPGDPVDPNPDALPPRPKVNPQPFELFAYDEQFAGSSSAAPRFPLDMRQRLQARAPEVVAPYETEAGTGVQIAVPTGWIGGPCMYFLGRMEPQPDQSSARIWLFVTSFVVAFGVALAAAAPMVLRVRKLSGLAQEAKNDGFSTLALDGAQGRAECRDVRLQRRRQRAAAAKGARGRSGRRSAALRAVNGRRCGHAASCARTHAGAGGASPRRADGAGPGARSRGACGQPDRRGEAPHERTGR